MKKLLFALAIILVFTGCASQQSGGEAVPTPSVTPSPTPEKKFIQVDNATNIINVEKIKILNIRIKHRQRFLSKRRISTNYKNHQKHG